MAEMAAFRPVMMVLPFFFWASIASNIVALSSATIPEESATKKSLQANLLDPGYSATAFSSLILLSGAAIVGLFLEKLILLTDDKF